MRVNGNSWVGGEMQLKQRTLELREKGLGEMRKVGGEVLDEYHVALSLSSHLKPLRHPNFPIDLSLFHTSLLPTSFLLLKILLIHMKDKKG